jgi:hypothetical protein
MRRLNRGFAESEESPATEGVRRRVPESRNPPPTAVDEDAANKKKKHSMRRNPFHRFRLFLQRNVLVVNMAKVMIAGMLVSFIGQVMRQSSTMPLAKAITTDFRVIFPSRVDSDISQQRELFHNPGPLNDEAEIRMKVKNFGDLNLRFFKYDDDETPRRSIFRAEQEDWTAEELYYWDPITETHLDEFDDHIEYYYSFDDDVARNPMIGYDDDKIQDEKRCRRTAWHRNIETNCNKLHEFDVERRFRDGETSFLG